MAWSFYRSGSADAVAELSVFVAADLENAARVMAELTEISNGVRQVPEEDRNATGQRGLLCRRTDRWAIFYVVPSRNRVKLLHVAELSTPSEELIAEAVRRKG